MTSGVSASGEDPGQKHMVPSEVDPAMAELKARQAEWAAMRLEHKADLLQAVRARAIEVCEDWARANLAVKGLDGEEGAGELVKVAAIVGGFLGRLQSVLRHAAKHGRLPEHPLMTIPSGQQVAKVFPVSMADHMDTYGAYGYSVEVWIQPGKPPSQGRNLLCGDKSAGLAVVLAAGNHSYIGLLDALDQLFIHNRVVLLKYHEVQAPLTPILEHILKPLRDRGYIQGVSAGIEVTQKLIFHPATTHVHMTGGNATHDMIVWGPPGAGRDERKRARDPLLKVPMSSELGNISPWIITPDSSWTTAQLEHHAQALAEAIMDNSSCNCLSAKMVLISNSWIHADEFVQRLKDAIRASNPIPAWYPGIQQRWAEFQKYYPEAELIESSRQEAQERGSKAILPVAISEFCGLPPDPEKQHCLTVEPFCPVVTIVRVPADSAEDFLTCAVDFCNERIEGTLTCTLLVHPNTERDNREAVDAAVAKLRYGLVAVNGWGGLGFATEVAHWGGFQRPEYEEGCEHYADALANPVSGLGTVHNAYMYDFPQKSVIRTPFVSGLHPKPRHITPLPMELPFTLSKPWLWRTARIFAGFVMGGASGIVQMLF